MTLNQDAQQHLKIKRSWRND